jgi:hypothetical protein
MVTKVVKKWTNRQDFFKKRTETNGDCRYDEVVECGKCGEVIFEHSKLPPEGRKSIWNCTSLVFHAGAEHSRVCSEKPEVSPEAVQTLQTTDGKGETVVNCPCCDKIMTSRNLLRHMYSKHLVEMAMSMSQMTRASVRESGLPIVYGMKDNRQLAYVCAECGKGGLHFGHNNFGLVPLKSTITKGIFENYLGRLYSKHRKCKASYATHAYLFEEGEQIDLLVDLDFKHPEKSPETEKAPRAPKPVPPPPPEPEPKSIVCNSGNDKNQLTKEFIAKLMDDLGIDELEEDEGSDFLLEEVHLTLTANNTRLSKVSRQLTETEGLLEDIKYEEALKRKGLEAEIKRLKKEIAEKESYESTFNVIKFSQSGRGSDIDSDID